MPRKPIDQYWIERIRSIYINEPDKTLADTWRELQDEAQSLGRDDYPSRRSIRRYRDKFKDAPEHERRVYEFVSWPETFEHGALPWEAAAPVLAIMGRLHWRPPVRFARWYYQLYLAVPDMDWRSRFVFARLLFLADSELLDEPETYRREIEEALMLWNLESEPEDQIPPLLDEPDLEDATWVMGRMMNMRGDT